MHCQYTRQLADHWHTARLAGCTIDSKSTAFERREATIIRAGKTKICPPTASTPPSAPRRLGRVSASGSSRSSSVICAAMDDTVVSKNTVLQLLFSKLYLSEAKDEDGRPVRRETREVGVVLFWFLCHAARLSRISQTLAVVVDHRCHGGLHQQRAAPPRRPEAAASRRRLPVRLTCQAPDLFLPIDCVVVLLFFCSADRVEHEASNVHSRLSYERSDTRRPEAPRGGRGGDAGQRRQHEQQEAAAYVWRETTGHWRTGMNPPHFYLLY